METTLEKALLKKTPCNECRKRKRKCSYEQPCERCKKLNMECCYTVIASPIDLEYMQELEYVKQVEELEAQICIMEKELNAFKLAKDKNDLENTQKEDEVVRVEEEDEELEQQVAESKTNEVEQQQQQQQQQEQQQKSRPDPINDYPSPVSIDSRTTPSPKLPTLSIDTPFELNRYHHGNHHHHHGFSHSPKFFDKTEKGHRRHGRKHHHHHKKHDHLVAKSGELNVYVAPQKEQKSWVLSVNKGGDLTINTYITSHAELLSQLKDILYKVDDSLKKPIVPMAMPDQPTNAYITSAINSFLWKSYGKQRIKNMTKGFHIEYKTDMVSNVVPFETLAVVAMKIIKAYLNCMHFNQFYLYAPYFLRHFMKANYQELLNSPAVMALCSTISLLPCKHVSSLIPYDAFSEYGSYYFEQARELISERFDDISLESAATYAFMGLYKLKLKEYNEGLRYADMARRIHSTLEPLYANDPTSEEALFLQRISRCIQFVSDSAFVHEMVAQGGPHKHGGRHNFVDLLKGNNIMPVVESEQDSSIEKEFILFIRLKSKLQHDLHHVILKNRSGSATLSSCVGAVSHQMEMSLRHWYRHALPENFQISLPLFEDSPSDLNFFTVLEKECQGDQVSPKLFCLIYVYNEYLVMAKAYLPKNPNEDFPTVDEIMKRFSEMEARHKFNDPLPPPRITLRWEKFVYRIIQFNRYHSRTNLQFPAMEEQHMRELLESVHLEDMNFNMPVAFVSVVSALNMVRLTQFLITKDYACFLDYKWLMNAWEVLLRASRFQYSRSDSGITLERIRANMLVCMKIIKQHPIYEKVRGIDDVLVKLEEEYNECIA